ncbi:hypothetical protein PC116_g33881 [Phytophthora cactorum]|nr:hypothetical protein PC116_g33881 [Phytophthora cactorum]
MSPVPFGVMSIFHRALFFGSTAAKCVIQLTRADSAYRM